MFWAALAQICAIKMLLWLHIRTICGNDPGRHTKQDYAKKAQSYKHPRKTMAYFTKQTITQIQNKQIKEINHVYTPRSDKVP